jgi:quinol-cytochrome oxidoreductase complex cytochrome b subunit
MSHGLAHSDFKSPTIRWIDQRLPIFTMMWKEYGEYPAPKNFNYFWNFGALAMVVLMVMIVTGIFLAFHYTPHVDHAFASVERIMRDVNYGWLLRYIHMNGASMFFVVVYIHMFRGLYYGSYKHPRELLWILGVVILLLMILTAFMGYVLPWGQMSFWAAKVITSLVSAVPFIGEGLQTWLWGAFSVDNPTLNRFFALHYLFPFIILGVVVLHVAALHITGSNNPLGIEPKSKQDTLPFHPYYTIKDTFGLGVFLLVFAFFVFFYPNYLGHPDNYVPANPLQTPAHIVPEWYFLPFYAILRAIDFDIGIFGITFIDAKFAGVLAMLGSIVVLCFLPWLDTSKVRSTKFRPVYKWFFWLLVIDVIVLGYCGAQPAEGIFVSLAFWGTIYYFAHFLVVLPLLGKFERPRPLPRSISEPVLPRGGGPVAAGATAKPMEKA